MKKKTFNKKLTVSKQTIAHLSQKDMQQIDGGTVVNPVPAPLIPVQKTPTYNCTAQTCSCGYTCIYTCPTWPGPICP